MTAGPLDFLKESAAAHHARAIEIDRHFAVFDVGPPSVSGAPAVSYRLRIEPSADGVIVREVQPGRLPRACPDRHISHDGSFCLYWAEIEPSAIATAADAEAWWMKLLTFLRRQQAAEVRRKWPGKATSRAHGPDAARQQMIAEEAAAGLGPEFRKLLDDFRLATSRWTNGGETRVQLRLDGRRLLSVREKARQLMTKRQRCKCDVAVRRRLPISACGRHEAALTNLTVALDRWKADERKFFRSHAISGTKCCGTQDDCPLAARGTYR